MSAFVGMVRVLTNHDCPPPPGPSSHAIHTHVLFSRWLHCGVAVALVLMDRVACVRGYRQMNATASELGAGHTLFHNPHGLDSEGAGSTAADLGKLAAIAMRSRLFRRVSGSCTYQAPVWEATGADSTGGAGGGAGASDNEEQESGDGGGCGESKRGVRAAKAARPSNDADAGTDASDGAKARRKAAIDALKRSHARKRQVLFFVACINGRVP